jgi:hypothetical protein
MWGNLVIPVFHIMHPDIVPYEEAAALNSGGYIW